MAKQSTDSPINKSLKRLELSHYLPKLRTFSLFAIVILSIFIFLFPLFKKGLWFWSSGPLANPHKMIEADCVKCHSTSFEPAQDKECKVCHSMTQHAVHYDEVAEKHPELNKRCAECHMDHNADAGIVIEDSKLCTDCHGDIKKYATEAAIVTSFEKHPEFKGEDTGKIKLNHALHLKPNLNGADGPVTLTCNSCHELAANFRDIKPIKFETNCQSCHTLGFDDRLPETQIVHGDAEAVFPALFTAYSKIFLAGNSSPDQTDRVKPGNDVLLADSPKMMSIKDVVSAARNAEKELFTKTACFLCHETGVKPDSEQKDENTHYTVTKPEIPDRWFTRAVFKHGSHEEISCESCHEKARKSRETKDLLLPKLDTCKECHLQGDRAGMIKSDCVLCHSYHDSMPIEFSKKREISDYLSRLVRG